MRLFHYGRILIVLVISGLPQACGDGCKVTSTYIYYTPVYSTSAEVKSAVQYLPPRTLSNLGKIYFKDNYLFVNEMGEGIHVIDNRNPSMPAPAGFLKIPGNYDLAILGNYLYADSFIDLVVFDVTDKGAIREVNRVERVFNNAQSYGYPMLLSNNLVLTSWKEERTVQVFESNCQMTLQSWGGRVEDGGIYLAKTTGGGGVAPASPTAGIGGSMGRFTISQNNLYALDGHLLDVISLATPSAPVPGKEVEVGWDNETLFPYKDKLFIGSRSGMYIYDLADPRTPLLLSKYEHMRSCDPVVVDDSYAYVTLRNGSSCQGFQNQLEVINITNLASPQLVRTYPMTSPHGLGIDNKTLFICDGPDGLKVFNASNVLEIGANQLAHYPAINALDVIPFQNVAMMISSDGLYQYNYADPKNIYLVSKLPIAH